VHLEARQLLRRTKPPHTVCRRRQLFSLFALGEKGAFPIVGCNCNCRYRHQDTSLGLQVPSPGGSDTQHDSERPTTHTHTTSHVVALPASPYQVEITHTHDEHAWYEGCLAGRCAWETFLPARGG